MKNIATFLSRFPVRLIFCITFCIIKMFIHFLLVCPNLSGMPSNSLTLSILKANCRFDINFKLELRFKY